MQKIIKKKTERWVDGGGNWKGYLVEGNWNGSIEWNEGTWSGGGKWWGNVISGKWEGGNGDWESSGNGSGKWKGNGKLTSNVPGPKYAAIAVTVIGFIANIVSAALGSIVGVIGWITTIISIVVIIIFLVYLARKNKKLEGKWKVDGIWREEEGSLILTMNGAGKLGGYEFNMSGKMRERFGSNGG
ncbi:MAG: hypothetical protein E4G94_04465 [ANME-2 cluster archaeon]|nr:MAG: hypothetical protein E4G94_04465 [ANME-2 cluster archaeon]